MRKLQPQDSKKEILDRVNGVRVSRALDMGRTWLKGIVKDFVNSLHRLVWRRMEDDDDGTKQAHGTTQLA